MNPPYINASTWELTVRTRDLKTETKFTAFVVPRYFQSPPRSGSPDPPCYILWDLSIGRAPVGYDAFTATPLRQSCENRQRIACKRIVFWAKLSSSHNDASTKNKYVDVA
ncbi:hypothetical protein QTP88_011838 [Uroleucon formosanum]